MNFSELIEAFEANLVQEHSLALDPHCNPLLTGVAAVHQAQSGTVSYIEGEKFAPQVATTGASALILPPDPTLQETATARGIAWVATPEPRLLFAMAIAQFYQPYRPAPQIHPTAVIDPTVQMGAEVAIGAHVVIERGVTLGDRVCIFPNVVIYPDCQIGAGTVLHANCTIEERTVMGENCIIHSGAVIGSEGFGFVPRGSQGWYKMNQSGYVELGDGVDIGCNTTIDRPAVGTTRLGNGTKIDNLVQIGHNCELGDRVLMCGQSGLAGQVTLGDGVILAGQVGISNDVKVGANVIATAQSGIHRDVTPDQIISGAPAMPNKYWLKVIAVYTQLPELYKNMRQLQRQLKALGKAQD